MLKIYLEQICINGNTFQYGEDGRPVKICADKKLVLITTSGGYLCENSSLELYWKELCCLFEIPEMLFIKAEGPDIQWNDPEEILQRAIESMSCNS